MAIPNLQTLQKDPIELERCQKDPVYFYNTYIRKEGEKVLDAKEFAEMEKRTGSYTRITTHTRTTVTNETNNP